MKDKKPIPYQQVYYDSDGDIQRVEWGFAFVGLILGWFLCPLVCLIELIKYICGSHTIIKEEDYYKRKIYEIKNK